MLVCHGCGAHHEPPAIAVSAGALYSQCAECQTTLEVPPDLLQLRNLIVSLPRARRQPLRFLPSGPAAA